MAESSRRHRCPVCAQPMLPEAAPGPPGAVPGSDGDRYRRVVCVNAECVELGIYKLPVERS